MTPISPKNMTFKTFGRLGISERKKKKGNPKKQIRARKSPETHKSHKTC